MNISRMAQNEFPFDDLAAIKLKAYGFANTFQYCSIYDSNSIESAMDVGRYEFLVAIGLKKQLPRKTDQLFEHFSNTKKWVFGYFEYQDLTHQSATKCDLYEPEMVLYINRNSKVLHIYNNGLDESDFEKLREAFQAFNVSVFEKTFTPTDFQPQTSKEEYWANVHAIREDIIKGKYYEMNYCIEFKSKIESVDFLPFFMGLNERTKAPFAAFVKNPNYTILCSSPERFLMKQGEQLVSQPIKGTNQRLEGEGNNVQIQDLKNSEKEIAENVMIVDLVRNDLARVCKHGSVKVDELCGVYTFKTVNHLISTIRGELKENVNFQDIMNSLFPMGSMTGAPKLEVMKHIELYEHAERGIYSGCLGYINPDGDFDFNVVIRSLVYDAKKEEMSYKVGSAITFDSEPEKEYEECLLKGKRLFDAMDT